MEVRSAGLNCSQVANGIVEKQRLNEALVKPAAIKVPDIRHLGNHGLSEDESAGMIEPSTQEGFLLLS
jgi:hypothetical protein